VPSVSGLAWLTLESGQAYEGLAQMHGQMRLPWGDGSWSGAIHISDWTAKPWPAPSGGEIGTIDFLGQDIKGRCQVVGTRRLVGSTNMTISLLSQKAE
jgi:hypothetical protein